jgi:hypothetical protein
MGGYYAFTFVACILWTAATQQFVKLKLSDDISSKLLYGVGGAFCALFGFILWLAGKTYLNAHPAHVYLEYNYY